jgi:Ca2+-binding EF-hand superfamily protein
MCLLFYFFDTIVQELSINEFLILMEQQTTETNSTRELIQALSIFDSRGTGNIPLPEFREAMTQLGLCMSEDEADQVRIKPRLKLNTTSLNL